MGQIPGRMSECNCCHVRLEDPPHKALQEHQAHWEVHKADQCTNTSCRHGARSMTGMPGNHSVRPGPVSFVDQAILVVISSSQKHIRLHHLRGVDPCDEHGKSSFQIPLDSSVVFF